MRSVARRGCISYDNDTHDSIDSSDTVRSFTTTVSVPAGVNLGALLLSGRVAGDNRTPRGVAETGDAFSPLFCNE